MIAVTDVEGTPLVTDVIMGYAMPEEQNPPEDTYMLGLKLLSDEQDPLEYLSDYFAEQRQRWLKSLPTTGAAQSERLPEFRRRERRRRQEEEAPLTLYDFSFTREVVWTPQMYMAARKMERFRDDAYRLGLKLLSFEMLNPAAVRALKNFRKAARRFYRAGAEFREAEGAARIQVEQKRLREIWNLDHGNAEARSQEEAHRVDPNTRTRKHWHVRARKSASPSRSDQSKARSACENRRKEKQKKDQEAFIRVAVARCRAAGSIALVRDLWLNEELTNEQYAAAKKQVYQVKNSAVGHNKRKRPFSAGPKWRAKNRAAAETKRKTQEEAAKAKGKKGGKQKGKGK